LIIGSQKRLIGKFLCYVLQFCLTSLIELILCLLVKKGQRSQKLPPIFLLNMDFCHSQAKFSLEIALESSFFVLNILNIRTKKGVGTQYKYVVHYRKYKYIYCNHCFFSIEVNKCICCCNCLIISCCCSIIFLIELNNSPSLFSLSSC